MWKQTILIFILLSIISCKYELPQNEQGQFRHKDIIYTSPDNTIQLTLRYNDAKAGNKAYQYNIEAIETFINSTEALYTITKLGEPWRDWPQAVNGARTK